MREFAIPYSEGLKRGLRKFPNSLRQEEWLTECHNLRPSEMGLLSHEIVTELNISEITNTIFEFFRIKNQNGFTWYWYIALGEMLVSVPNPPSVSNFSGFEKTPAIIPYWLRITSYDNSTLMYMYPEVDGSFRVKTSAPSIGTQLDVSDGFPLVSLDGNTYKIKAHSGEFYAIAA